MRLFCYTQTLENRIYRSQLQSYSDCIFTFVSLFCLCHTERILSRTDKWLQTVTVLYKSLRCNLQILFIKHVWELESKVARNLFQNWFTNNIQQLLTFLIKNKIRKDRLPKLTIRHQPGTRPPHLIHWAFACDLHNPPVRLDVACVKQMCRP